MLADLSLNIFNLEATMRPGVTVLTVAFADGAKGGRVTGGGLLGEGQVRRLPRGGGESGLGVEVWGGGLLGQG